MPFGRFLTMPSPLSSAQEIGEVITTLTLLNLGSHYSGLPAAEFTFEWAAVPMKNTGPFFKITAAGKPHGALQFPTQENCCPECVGWHLKMNGTLAETLIIL